MGTMKNAGLDEIYDFIMRSGSLEEVGVATKPASFDSLFFLELNGLIQKNILPDIEEMNDVSRAKARFMLDVCVLNLLRKKKMIVSSDMIAIDLHFSTLEKTAFRTRYFVVLADFLAKYDCAVMLNVRCARVGLNTTRISDLLRYLLPYQVEVAVQVNQDNILAQDLNKITVDHFVLSVAELTSINNSARRDMTMARLSQLPGYKKDIIIRNGVAIPVETQEDAFYL